MKPLVHLDLFNKKFEFQDLGKNISLILVDIRKINFQKILFIFITV
jgi:hypothetical protein